MSQLYDMKILVEEKIRIDGLDPKEVKGKLGLRTGILFAFLNPNSVDKPEAVEKLRKAAKEVLNMTL